MTSSEQSDWLYCELVRVGRLHFRDPYCLGQAELTRKTEWHPNAEKALRESVAAFGLHLEPSYLRARCLFLDATRETVAEQGSLCVQEVAELLAFTMMTPSRPTSVSAGFMYDLRRDVSYSHRPPSDTDSFGYPVFHIDELAHQPKLMMDVVLAADPALSGEVGSRLRRSAHWYRQGIEAKDISGRLLNLWIAAECLCKVGDDDVLTARFLAGLGMARGKYYQQLQPSHRMAYDAAKAILDPWRTKLAALFEAGRTLRNSIAHEGARELEVRASLGEGDLVTLVTALELLVPRLQNLALAALARRLISQEQMWDNYGVLYADIRQGAPPTADAIGTIIFRLSEE